MSRAQFTAQYDVEADLADLAADYLFGLSTTQGFIDGNKRAAVTAALHFLRKNGWELVVSERILYIVAMAVARNELDHDELAEEIRDHLVPLEEQG
jgi:death on curing protein